MNTANWNLEPHAAGPNPVADRQVGATGAIPAGLGVVEGGTIPYKPEALERLDQHRQHLINYDPEAACYLPGIPRATYLPYPFQIVQGGNDDMLMVYEYANANRVIEMRDVEIPPIDTWMGTSYGRWDGDTLVVVTLSQGPGEVKLPGGVMEPNGVTWLDRAGNYLSHDRDGDRALHQDGRQPHPVQRDDRGSGTLHPAVDYLDAALPPPGAERPAARVPLRSVQRAVAIRRPARGRPGERPFPIIIQ